MKNDRRRRMDRWLPWMVTLLALAVTVSISMSTFAFVLNSDRVDDINRERMRNTVSACLDRSAQNQRIADYLKALGARPESIEQARKFFPVSTGRECEAQARKRVGS